MKKKITARIDSDMLEWLLEESIKDNTSFSEQVNYYLYDAFRKSKPQEKLA